LNNSKAAPPLLRAAASLYLRLRQRNNKVLQPSGLHGPGDFFIYKEEKIMNKVMETIEKNGIEAMSTQQLIGIIIQNEKKVPRLLGQQDLFVTRADRKPIQGYLW
jgi:hypothetical protein